MYTTDFDGRPVVTDRLHWVLTEAIGAAAALLAVTGEQQYDDWYRTFWDHADAAFRDREHGSWRHELDERLQPSARTWAGKPDVYHALQATLIPAPTRDREPGGRATPLTAGGRAAPRGCRAARRRRRRGGGGRRRRA